MAAETSQCDEHIDLKVVAEHETLTLTSRDWEAFLDALDDDGRPRPRLKAAALSYQSRRDRDAG